MNDHGGPSSERLEYKENGITKDGTYCTDCASDIKSCRVPIMSSLDIVFCLKHKDSKNTFIKFTEISKESLKKSIIESQLCDTVSVERIDYDKNDDEELQMEKFQKAFKDDDFTDPKTTYEFFINEFIGEVDVDDEFSWILPPVWPLKKRLQLANEIFDIKSQIALLEGQIKKKQRKLEMLK